MVGPTSKVLREGKYAIAVHEYPYAEYPPYCKGTLNLMRTDLAVETYVLSNMVSRS